MAAFTERVFGQIAVRLGFATQAQVDAGVREQEGMAEPPPLGFVLVQHGFITAAQATAVLRRQQELLARPPAAGAVTTPGELFGQIAVALGMVRAQDVANALQVQARGAANGVGQPLGEVLVDFGLLTLAQVVTILEAQAHAVRFCNQCGKPAIAPAAAPSEGIRCDRCRAGAAAGPIAAPAPADLRLPAAPAQSAGAPASVAPAPPAAPALPPAPARVARTPTQVPPPRSPRTPTVVPAPRRAETRADVPPRMPVAPAGAAAGPLASAGASAAAPPSVPPTPASPAPGRQHFGNYELLEELGRGGSGIVYKAWHCVLKRNYALKVLSAECETSPEAVIRFRREAEITDKLRHPGIVSVRDIGEVNGRIFFAMEYVEGQSLDHVLANPTAAGLSPAPGSPPRDEKGRIRWGIDPHEAAAMARTLAETLHAAHAAGVIHRDLKPANILRDARGRLKILDFGLARLVDAEGQPSSGPGIATCTRANLVIGTPAFMSPEQAEGHLRDLDARSDIYQTGAILYQMLTGHAPYEGPTSLDIAVQVLHQAPVPPRHRNPGIDPELEAICVKCMAREPADRYATAASLAADLNRFLQGRATRAGVAATETDATAPRPSSGLDRRRRLAVGAGAAAALVLIAGLLAATTGSNGGPAARPGAAAGSLPGATPSDPAGLLADAEACARGALALLHSADLRAEAYRSRVEKALALCEQAAVLAPTDGWVLEARGRARLRLHDLDGAEEDLGRAVQALGRDDGKIARRSLGRVYLERALDLADRAKGAADKQESGTWLARALGEALGSAGNVKWRGMPEEEEGGRRVAEGLSLFARGRTQPALECLRSGAEGQGDADSAWALAQVTSGPERERWLERALELCPGHARALADRARARRKGGDLDGAIADLTLAVALVGPDRAPTWTGLLADVDLARAEAEHARGNAAGVTDFDAAIAADPRRAAAYAGRALARCDAGDPEGALVDVAAAARLDPRSAEDPRFAAIYRDRGLQRFSRGDLDGAVADLEEAMRRAPKLAADPRWARVYVGRARVRHARGSLIGAANDVDQALRIDAKVELDAQLAREPGLARVFVARGTDLVKRGDLEGAILLYERARRCDPADPEASYRLGLAYRQKGDEGAAAAAFRAALQTAPQNWPQRGEVLKILDQPDGSMGYANRGTTRLNSGDVDGALADYEEAIRLDRSNATAWWGRASVRYRKGDLDGAIADLRQALAEAPADWAYRAQVQRDLVTCETEKIRAQLARPPERAPGGDPAPAKPDPKPAPPAEPPRPSPVPGAKVRPLPRGVELDPCPVCHGRRRIEGECPSCSGKGKAACGRCGGKGKLPCAACNGRGKKWDQTACDSCGGSGLGSYRCPACGASGLLTCSSCNGDRKSWTPCATCWGTGKVRGARSRPAGPDCPACGGARAIVCPTCGGTRAVDADCPACVHGSTVCTKCPLDTPAQCSTCGGERLVKCTLCNRGTVTRSCDACFGTGEVPCPLCTQ